MTTNINQKEVEKQKYQMLLKACKSFGGDIALYQKLKFNIPQLVQILKGLESKLDVSYYLDPKISAPHMEILRKGLAQGISLKMWLDQGFTETQIKEAFIDHIAFGDDMNDLGMLKLVGTAVAVSNAIDEVKAIADDITDSNDDDGVAKYLEKAILA